jgi:hypothetical protein
VSECVDYSALDPILDDWATRHGVEWVRKDRDWDVRSLWWPLATPESVQLWLDVPVDDRVTVHVCHNTTRGGQEHTEATADLDRLADVLDERFETAQHLFKKLK